MNMNEYDFIESMSVLNVQPGDVIVIKTNKILKPEQTHNIRNILEKVLLHAAMNNQVLILDDGLDIGVMHKQNVQEQAETAIKETH